MVRITGERQRQDGGWHITNKSINMVKIQENSLDANYFDQIPKELTLIIISYLNLNLGEVLR